MIKKCMYEAPETELLLVRFEGNFLQGTNPGGGFSDPNADPDDESDQNWWGNN